MTRGSVSAAWSAVSARQAAARGSDDVGGKADSEMLEAALMGGLAAGAGVVLTEALAKGVVLTEAWCLPRCLPRPRKVSMIGSALVLARRAERGSEMKWKCWRRR